MSGCVFRQSNRSWRRSGPVRARAFLGIDLRLDGDARDVGLYDCLIACSEEEQEVREV